MFCICGCADFEYKHQHNGPYEFRFLSCNDCGRMADERLLNKEGGLVASGFVARLEFERLERQAEIEKEKAYFKREF